MGLGFLQEQHRMIHIALNDLQSDGYRRNRVLLKLIGLLSAHLTVEINVLYPSVRRAVGTGDLDSQLKVLRRMKDVLLELARDVRGPEFAVRARELTRLFDEHVLLQEADLFPACSRAIRKGALDEIMGDVETLSYGLLAKARPFVRGDELVA